MTWKTFLVAWLTGTLGVTLGRWLWAWRARRQTPPKKEGGRHHEQAKQPDMDA